MKAATRFSSFADYLTAKGLSASTVVHYVREVSLLESALGMSGASMGYSDLYGWLRLQQRQGKSKSYQQHRLGIFRHYFGYLVGLGVRTDHPGQHLYLHRAQCKRVDEWLPFSSLESLFDCYESLYPDSLENQVLLSLLIYQGLTVSDLKVLKLGCFDFKKGKLTVASGRRSHGRVLSLDLRQMLLLIQFTCSAALDEEGLLFWGESPAYVKNKVGRLMQVARGLCPGLKNAVHIRGSVLVHWLRSEDLRIVQYKAGHRYVSSTERYQVAHLEELQQAIGKVHPLGSAEG